MIKKFFVAMILGLLMMSSQIAAAAEYDEWVEVPEISNKAELFRHIEQQRRWGHTKIYATLINGFKVEQLKDKDGQFMNFALSIVVPYLRVIVTQNSDGTEELELNITEYPGTRVALAYLRNDTEGLTVEEMQLYEVAVSIVDEANKRQSGMAKAKYIHDEIRNRATFELDKSTAISALIYGRADCDGYTDSFYMLGRMLELNVGRIGGFVNGEAHAWNWITFNDGKSYCIDVTIDDTFNSYDWFLKTRAQMEKTHSCAWEVIPNLQ